MHTHAFIAPSHYSLLAGARGRGVPRCTSAGPPAAMFAYRFNADDYMVAFSIVCTVVGVGSLNLPGTMANAGPILTPIAFWFVALSNLYATLCVTKLMHLAPSYVHTLGKIQHVLRHDARI